MEHSNKNNLQKRTIQPSADSWGKLDRKLSDFERIKKNKNRQFLRYAASILIIFSVGVYFFGFYNKPMEIVEKPAQEIEEKEKESIVKDANYEIAESENNDNSSKEIQTKSLKNEALLAERTLEKSSKSDQIHKGESKIDAHLYGIDSLQNQKINTIVFQIENSIKNKGEVSAVEIENLLIEAQKSIKSERKNMVAKKFKGSDLLADVEYDLDKDFKERLYDAIVNTLKDPKNIIVNKDN